MTVDAAQAYYAIDALVLSNINNVSITPAGGELDVRRGISRSKKPLGWKNGQEAHFTLTWDVDLTENGLEVDYYTYYKNKTEFTFTEHADTSFTNYYPCKISNLTSSTDANGNVTLSIETMALYSDYVA